MFKNRANCIFTGFKNYVEFRNYIMKIALSPQWKTPKINQQLCASKNIQKGVQNSAVNASPFSFDNRAVFLSFGAIQKINKPKEFNDLDKTAEYLENKIQLSLKEKDAEDIQNIIDSVSEKTNADKKLVAETLGRLVQFSSYSQLKNLDEELSNRNFGKFYFSGNMDNNHLFDFIKERNLITCTGRYSAHVVDNYNVSWLSSLKNKSSALKNRMIHSLNKNELKFVVLDGFSVNIGGQPKSYNLFGADETLENLTTQVVEKVQRTGKSLDEIFIDDKVAIIKNVFGEDVPIEVIKNPKLTDYSAESIAQIIKPDYPTKEQIKAVIKVIAEKTAKKERGETPEYVQKLLSNYVDIMLRCYSVENFNELMKKQYSQIEKKVKELGKTMNDVLYIIPDDRKSFKLITAQFMKVNGISNKKCVINNGDAPFEKDKVYVILDDFFGTGTSVTSQEFNYIYAFNKMYYDVEKRNSINFIFSPLLCDRQAVVTINNNIKSCSRVGKDFLIADDITDYFQYDFVDDNSSLSEKERSQVLYHLGRLGFCDTMSCAVFPYSFPDNNSNFSSLLTYFFFPSKIDSEYFKGAVDKNWVFFSDFPHVLDMVKKEYENEDK